MRKRTSNSWPSIQSKLIKMRMAKANRLETRGTSITTRTLFVSALETTAMRMIKAMLAGRTILF